MKIGLLNTAFVGDVALMGRLIDALSLAGHQVILFSNAAGCALFEHDQRISKRIVVRKNRGFRKFNSMIGIARELRLEQLDILLLAHRSWTSGLIGLLSGYDRIVTFSDSSLVHRCFRLVDVSEQKHESDKYLALAKEIVPGNLMDSSRLHLFGDSALPKFLKAFPGFFETAKSPFFICAPGSVWPTKRYPPHLLADLICRLLRGLPHTRCVLSGGPSDAAVIDEVKESIRNLAPELISDFRVFDARACLPLSELIELTRRADFVLTPDSAPLHIASATGTKTFAFFGPTSFESGFGPLNKNSEVISFRMIKGEQLPCQPCSKHGQDVCPLKHHRCLSELPPDVIARHMITSLSQ